MTHQMKPAFQDMPAVAGTNTVTLEFDPADVRKLVAHAMAAAEHLPCMGDQFVAKHYAGGKIPIKNEWPDISRIDTSKIPPALFLVNDSFLMSNGVAPDEETICIYKNDHTPSDSQNEADAQALGAEELPNVTRILAREFDGIDDAQLVRIMFENDPRKGITVSLELVGNTAATPNIKIISRRA